MLAVSQARIKAYESWTVKYELADAEILKSLGRAILRADTAQGKADLSRGFAQLYSFVMQRYIAGNDILDKADIAQLASVIVDVEQNAVGKLLGTKQSDIQSAIEKKKLSVVRTGHDFLLGSAIRAGTLPEMLKFNYGTDAAGAAITFPKRLPDPPKKTEQEK